MSIELIQRGPIAELILNRPEKHNAFDDTMLSELLHQLDHIQKQNSIRVVILKSRGKNFSAGADLGWMQRMAEYSHDENIADSQQLADVMKSLYSLNKPTIALVQGSVYGGANGLVTCCDMALATIEAEFCFSEVKLGLVPAVISPYVIAAIGERNARRYFLTAELISAITARDIGLVHELCETDQLESRGLALANQILKNGPEALATCKQLITTVRGQPINDTLIRETVNTIARTRVSPEGQEGLKAFLQKRQPNWMES
jgi:methylglutaconyl-CoA hydratase